MKSAFARYATAFGAYLLFVILFGAWVRITHSGAGCGSHWPTCHGEFIPFEPTTETMIEYTHRLTSGLLGIFGLVMVGWAYKRHRFGRVFQAAVVTLLLIVFEALIGAGIVLKELVADDASVARAIVISLHLANTLILTAAASLTVYWDVVRTPFSPRARKSLFAVCVAGLVLLVLTSMTGAVTALGDTLFPVQATTDGSLWGQISGDLSPANHFLVRLRIVHPILAVVAALALAALSAAARAKNLALQVDLWASALFLLVITQVFVGMLNVALAAPGWMQLVHLLMAQLVWISAVLLTVAVGSEESA